MSETVVLAERATQLYRDTDYHDLITFEEDIAKIASVVLVIAESPGSLAELGAFASSRMIRPRLRILLQETHVAKESFIRYGPVERIKRDNRAHLGVYPWRTHGNGSVIKCSLAPHFSEILLFIQQHLQVAPRSEMYVKAPELAPFILLYWLVFLFMAVSPAVLYEAAVAISPDFTPEEIRNKLYCMQVAGWIEEFAYSGQDYFCVTADEDPFAYRFKPGFPDKESLRRKIEVTQALGKLAGAPKQVRSRAAGLRGAT